MGKVDPFEYEDWNYPEPQDRYNDFTVEEEVNDYGNWAITLYANDNHKCESVCLAQFETITTVDFNNKKLTSRIIMTDYMNHNHTYLLPANIDISDCIVKNFDEYEAIRDHHSDEPFVCNRDYNVVIL